MCEPRLVKTILGGFLVLFFGTFVSLGTVAAAEKETHTVFGEFGTTST